MILNSDMYVPGIRWRQGEYQALSRLSPRAKEKVVPLITIPEVEFDFEEWRPKKSIHEHVHPFAARFKTKWGKRPAWIALHKAILDQTMNDGRDIFSYVFDGLRTYGSAAVPAVPLKAPLETQNAVKAILRQDGRGCGVLVRLEDLMMSDIQDYVHSLLYQLDAVPSKVDLIIDLGSPNFEPYDAFAIALKGALDRLGELDSFRNLVLIATAYPETLKDVARGKDEIPRHDWLFYQAFLDVWPVDLKPPVFGDHTIVHPNFIPMDMRKVKSAGKLIYTTPKTWLVHKGGAFRDNPAQMHGHCAAIVGSGFFRAAEFSYGDDYIAGCAIKASGYSPSNQSRWKDVAINHHMHQVLDDLSKSAAAS